MSRSYDEHPLKTSIWLKRRHYEITVYDLSTSNPTSSYRKMWRRQARVRQDRILRNCQDFSELQIETKITKLTSIYDWY
jgi:hypothetical protein